MIDPKNYDYLWSNHEVNFIFTSCYAFKKETEMLLAYDWQKKELKFFLSKKDRKSLSDYAIDFYKNKYFEWEKKIRKDVITGKNIIENAINDKPEELTNQKIKLKIQRIANLFHSLTEDYFFTEFFFTEKVEKSSEAEILRRLEAMSRIKLEARGILNKFYDYNTVFSPYVEELAKRTNRKDMQWLSYKEIIDLIDGKDIPFSEREKEYWVLFTKNNRRIKGDEAFDLIKRFDKHYFSIESDELSGIMANPGSYKGRVKVLRTLFNEHISKEINKVKEGDILVANTTGPEVMLACQRAGAIITDEGGLTSHAAIVSRELKIPCIVGTKIATRILKNGDLVEVDADHGVVRKLNK